MTREQVKLFITKIPTHYRDLNRDLNQVQTTKPEIPISVFVVWTSFYWTSRPSNSFVYLWVEKSYV
jgi:hypothetical protein